MADAFARTSAGLVAQMKGLSTVEAVQSFTYDRAANVVRLDVATKLSRPVTSGSLYDGEAWYLASGVSPAYWNQNLVSVEESGGGSVSLLAAFHETLDGVLNYECPPDVMVAFAAKTAGQAEFDARCRK